MPDVASHTGDPTVNTGNSHSGHVADGTVTTDISHPANDAVIVASVPLGIPLTVLVFTVPTSEVTVTPIPAVNDTS